MTGDESEYGESMKRGIDLALEMDREILPTGFEILWGDTASDPATGASELKRLAGEGAGLFVAGTTSDTARELLPLLEETDTIAVSPSASAPSLTKDSRRFFRVFASDELEGRRAGRFLYDDQDKTSGRICAEEAARQALHRITRTKADSDRARNSARPSRIRPAVSAPAALAPNRML